MRHRLSFPMIPPRMISLGKSRAFAVWAVISRRSAPVIANPVTGRMAVLALLAVVAYAKSDHIVVAPNLAGATATARMGEASPASDRGIAEVADAHAVPATTDPPERAPIASVAAPSGDTSTTPVDTPLKPVERPIQILLDKAAFWDTKGQHDTAIALYRRVLAAVPDNVDALVGAATVTLTAGHQDAAQVYIDRLRVVAPSDARLAGVLSLRSRTPEELATLEQARHLAGEGHIPEALAAFQKVIRSDAVPADLALEYYPLVITGAGPDSVEAADALTALGALAEQAPQSDVVQLVYARAEITQEGNRADGIAKLRTLARNSTVADEARGAWRAALLWQGADAQAQQQLEAYLQENPSDPELEAKREEYRASLPSEGQWAKMRAYEAMRTKQFAVAETAFQAAIAFDANDVDAIIMMAAIRQQQGRIAESRKLAERAVAGAPERRQELLAIVGADPQAATQAAAAAARAVAAQYQEVAALAKKGDLNQAEQKLRRLMQSSPTAGNYLQLGDLQTRAGRLDDAAASLRKAITMAPANADAKIALAGVLGRQGHKDEAAALEAQAEDALARGRNTAGLAALHTARAARLRSQAAELHDAAARVAPLREAVDLDPSNAWLRLELARALRSTGAEADAKQVMSGLAVPKSAEPAAQSDRLVVAFFWSEELGDWPAAAAVAARVPPAQRTPEMVDVQTRMAVHDEIAGATHSGDLSGNRTRLMAVAANPDPSGSRGAEIARAYLLRGDTENAKRAVNAALANTPIPTPGQRLAYAGVLLEAGLGSEARAMADGITQISLTADQRRVFKRLDDDLAADQADALIGQKKLVEAQALIAKRLTESPENSRLKLSLSHWHKANGESDAALAVCEELLARQPKDLGVLHATIDAAIAAGALRRADQLVEDGLARFAEDPFLRMEAAAIARNRSDYGRALGFLEQARNLRAHQLASAQ